MRKTVALLLVFALYSPPAAAVPQKKIGRARITFYWITDEASYPRSTRAVIKDVHGHVLARTSARFRRDLLMEGSGVLRDGRTVTYDRHVQGEARFRLSAHEYGSGIGKCPLVPYHTIAVDPHFIPLGTRVYIPAFEGLHLPDGSVHDGMFMANDRSARIRGTHIDIFTSRGPRSARPFTRKGYRSGSHVMLYLADPPERNGCQSR